MSARRMVPSEVVSSALRVMEMSGVDVVMVGWMIGDFESYYEGIPLLFA